MPPLSNAFIWVTFSKGVSYYQQRIGVLWLWHTSDGMHDEVHDEIQHVNPAPFQNNIKTLIHVSRIINGIWQKLIRNITYSEIKQQFLASNSWQTYNMFDVAGLINHFGDIVFWIDYACDKQSMEFIWILLEISTENIYQFLVNHVLPWICGAFGLYPWQSELMRPLVVGWTTAFALEDGIDMIGAFRRIDSKSRKWLGNVGSKNGRWPMPNARNGWLPFGPDMKLIHNCG